MTGKFNRTIRDICLYIEFMLSNNKQIGTRSGDHNQPDRPLNMKGHMTTLKEIQSKEDSPSLSDAQKFVGGWVECVHLDTGTLIVDEEGKLKDKPVNEVASKMYADKYGDEDIIVGDAIFIPNGIPSDWHR